MWTLHNAAPHRGHNPSFERWARWLAARVDALVVHPGAGPALARQLVENDRLLAVPMGPYRDAFPSMHRDDARRKWCLRDRPVLVFFGHVREQKGLLSLVHAVQSLPTEQFDLVIAARVKQESLAAQIESLAAEDERVCWVADWLSETDLGSLLSAADAAVLPFRSATTSSSAQLASEFGLPLIGPDLPALAAFGPQPFLYSPAESDGLTRSIRAFMRQWTGPDPGPSYQPPPWSEAVAPLIGVYRGRPRRALEAPDP